MNTAKKTFPPYKQAALSVCHVPANCCRLRHYRAMRFPKTPFERALVSLFNGWKEYARAHQDGYESSIHADGVLGEAWAQIGEGLLGLLNGERGRLDGGTLDRAIRDLLPPETEETPSGLARNVNARKVRWEDLSVSHRIEKGLTVDVTSIAHLVGFRTKVMITHRLWTDIYAIPEPLRSNTAPPSRLFDVLSVGHFEISSWLSTRAPSELFITGPFFCYQLEMPVGKALMYEVQIHGGFDDNGEPVLTLMQADEG